jgi:hypothetical protein
MSAGLDSFLSLYAKIAPDRAQSIYYYPEKAIQRIREGQMAVFYDECEKDGLMKKNGSSYILSEKGLQAVAAGDAGVLVAPYHRAKKRINLLYIDVLI